MIIKSKENFSLTYFFASDEMFGGDQYFKGKILFSFVDIFG